MNKIQEIKNNHNVTPLFKLPNSEDIENIIDCNLRHDWMIRIEYTDSVVMYHTQWQQWGETKYAIKNSAKLMEDIYACRARFSKHSIRLSAERMYPQTKMIYSIYRPGQEVEGVTYPFVEIENVMAASELAIPGKSNWARQFYGLTGKAGTGVWRIVAIISMLITSFLLIAVQ